MSRPANDASWSTEHEGQVVASGTSPTIDGAIGQALHYHRTYGRDGGPTRTKVLDPAGDTVLRAYMNLPAPSSKVDPGQLIG